jgi:hypothetical protein
MFLWYQIERKEKKVGMSCIETKQKEYVNQVQHLSPVAYPQCDTRG